MGEKQGLLVAQDVGRMPFEVTRGGSILVGIPPIVGQATARLPDQETDGRSVARSLCRAIGSSSESLIVPKWTMTFVKGTCQRASMRAIVV